jgi:SagB-type dehydrogenase family enzyme
MNGTNGTVWPLGVRIRPAADPGASHVEVADTITGRRFRWSPDALSAFILSGGGQGELKGDAESWRAAIGTSSDREHLAAGWHHWQQRGWYPSDQYYAASRHWRFADVNDPDRAVRTRVLERYLAGEGPPPEEALPDGPRAPLPDPAPPPKCSVAQLLTGRRSGRSYVDKPVSGDWLSGLLWYGLAQIRARRERTDEKRPLSYLDSFGSAWDFYVCAFSVEGIAPGTYRYDIRRHELIGIRPGDHRETMAKVLQGMWSPRTAGWTLGLVADFPRYQWRYRHEHGLRRLYLESGIIAQELIIVGEAYGLSTLVTPAQRDTPYLELHNLRNDRYAPVYTLTMGHDRGAIDAARQDGD